MQIIREFQGEYRFLSNFWPAKITFGDWTFPSAEHAYQAAKSLGPQDWKDAQKCISPGAAKGLARDPVLSQRWHKHCDALARQLGPEERILGNREYAGLPKE